MEEGTTGDEETFIFREFKGSNIFVINTDTETKMKSIFNIQICFPTYSYLANSFKKSRNYFNKNFLNIIYFLIIYWYLYLLLLFLNLQKKFVNILNLQRQSI